MSTTVGSATRRESLPSTDSSAPATELDERELSTLAWAQAVTSAIQERTRWASAPELPSARQPSYSEAMRPEGPLDDATPGAGPPGRRPAAVESNAAPKAELRTQLEDDRLGRLELQVSRSARGLDIVINVADASVKQLIETEASALSRNLASAGLRVSSVEIIRLGSTGTGLAVDRTVARERARAGLNPRLEKRITKAYVSSIDEEGDDDSQGVNLEA